MLHHQLESAVSYLKKSTSNFEPRFGIILGTGLGKLVDEIEVLCEIPYEAIPHFVKSTVEFHSGKLIFGYLGGKSVVCMQGRFHYYEGFSMEEVTFPVRVMKLLGIERLFISNASGGLNPAFKESDLMIINDHIALFLPANPLIGENIMGDRFPDMSEPYDQGMIAMARHLARENGIGNIHEGVYVSVTGPSLETRAEYRMLRMLGADAVGMSTVPEVLVARQIALPVFGISVITDMCIPETLKVAELSRILEAAYKAEPAMTLIIKELISKL